MLLLRAGVERNPGPTLGAGYHGATVAVAEVDLSALRTVHKRGCARFYAKLEDARKAQRTPPTLHVVCLVKSGNQLRPTLLDVTPIQDGSVQLATSCDPQKASAGQVAGRSREPMRIQTIAHVRPTGQPAVDDNTSVFPAEFKSVDTPIILDAAVWGGRLFARPPWWTAGLTQGWSRIGR
jgi:hypothetical protein